MNPKFKIGVLLLYGLYVQAQTVQTNSCLLLKGVVVDYATTKALQGAHFFVKQSAALKKITTSNELGRFSVGIPCEAMTIQIEKNGYRPQSITIRALDTKPNVIAFQVPLLAVDRQQNDHAYLQSEQKEYVQQNNSNNSTETKASQHGHFNIIDALRDKPLKASVCFIYTKNAEKKCTDTDPNGKLDIDFTERDIVAVEVSADNYQRYEGNLLIESLDGRHVTHPIALQRELTILAIQANKGAQYELATRTKTYKLTQVPGQANWYSTFEVLPGTYDLIIKQSGAATSQSVQLQTGLNYITLPTETPKKTPKAVAPATPVAIRPDSLPMIYFEQSSYTLRTDSQEILKQVALYLKSHQRFLVQVEGHTDNVGDERLNKDLSEFRAAVVVHFLTRQGIEESRCQKVGYGSQYPISPNDTEANKSLNRRVSLKLIAAQ
ncbi:OmpA family protein [Spirosoma sp. 48-14]|uniref:OmpA family protein n=1 Tax=Spirosoma sp. 48-14 TaxID=1895854 RepID=UPI00096765B2|nr:OmpA family protein [Spirosoma sp. 48-14]OJW74265.1 MAG: hypothetical protein BGO59_14215 [Spirosoma sp. 48-14]